jgi:hypothetical protein
MTEYKCDYRQGCKFYQIAFPETKPKHPIIKRSSVHECNAVTSFLEGLSGTKPNSLSRSSYHKLIGSNLQCRVLEMLNADQSPSDSQIPEIQARWQDVTEVHADRYILRVWSIENHHSGSRSNGRRRNSRDCLDQTVTIIGFRTPRGKGKIPYPSDQPTPDELLAAKHNSKIVNTHRNITNENKGYARLEHQKLVRDIRLNYSKYAKKIKAAGKRVT